MLGKGLFFCAGSGTKYQITKSLRARPSASTYLVRTQTTPTLGTKMTVSLWIKRCALNITSDYVMGIGTGGATPQGAITFYDGNDSNYYDQLFFGDYSGTSWTTKLVTTQVFRDVGAWYHVVVSVDTTQATAANRVIIYVNGNQVSSLVQAVYPAQNSNLNGWNANTINAYIGQQSSVYGSSYVSDVNFVDGQALGPAYFGAIDPNNPSNWVPINPNVSAYGNNGYRLQFLNSGSIGTDTSGKGNNFTSYNYATTDQVSDSPTNNYPTWNVLDHNSSATLTNGALSLANGAGHYLVRSTQQLPSSGLWYAESTTLTACSSTVATAFGLATASASLTSGGFGYAGLWSIYASATFYLWNQTTSVSPSGTAAAGSIYQIAYDATNNRAWVGYNNTWYDSSGGTTGNPSAGTNPTFTALPTGLFFVGDAYSNTLTSNFGQTSFTYTPPTGFNALCAANMPAVSITQPNKYFDATLYTGTGANQSITNAGAFQPDLVWCRERNVSTNHAYFDSVRGVSAGYLSTNTVSTESYISTLLTSFNSNGFSVGADTNDLVNGNTRPIVAFQWKAGRTGSTNTNGSITSTVSANTTAGFSVGTFAGNGGTFTVGHGLNTPPAMILVRTRNSINNTIVYHQSMGNTECVYLNLTNGTTTSINCWNNTSPTSTVFSVGPVLSAGNCVFYAFAQVAGFSSFGKYVANGSSDGPFVYTGFRPRWVMVKNITTGGSDWEIFDSSRMPVNGPYAYLTADQSAAEQTGTTRFDILSNGFKVRIASSTDINNSTDTIIYAAFAESPFGGSNISPVVAR